MSAEEKTTRYVVSEDEDAQVVVCKDAPNVLLRVERGLTVSESRRKRYSAQTIFLDGVYTGAPFYDNKARQYSLDHHTGCVRAFTLATCEQAVVMVLQGIPLDEGTWTLLINEPDMDALLAAWVLMNHSELRNASTELLRQAMPLIRVEGVIDAHGLEMDALTALPQKVYHQKKGELDRLMARELQLKAAEEWGEADLLLYSRDILEDIDQLLYPVGFLEQLLEVEEIARELIHGEKQAFLCKSSRGIYQVEAQLKERHGKCVGLIVLDQGDGRFTIRQVDPFLPGSLGLAFKKLNQLDPLARADGDEENLWGGSDDIGGSPRRGGSGLDGLQVLQAVKQAYTSTNWWGRLFQRIKT